MAQPDQAYTTPRPIINNPPTVDDVLRQGDYLNRLRFGIYLGMEPPPSRDVLVDAQTNLATITDQVFPPAGTPQAEMVQLRGDIRGFMTRYDHDQDTFGTTLRNLEHTLANLRNEIQGIHTDVQGIRTDVQGIRNDVQGIRNDVQGVRNEIQDIRNDIEGVRNELDTDRKRREVYAFNAKASENQALCDPARGPALIPFDPPITKVQVIKLDCAALLFAIDIVSDAFTSS
ncbi:hypothetical protein NP233_g12792 [Leucocoprinus birnbaumii]|uniref:Uncharacterized protein n=1 Tax=Leucocoprinus birnbaumii TaxID=56174 RepID=A0AAD5YPN3_9AGAR|nr:hypothetical protein NP233_g12792 [Leucocoprinus birnbaumii]